MAYLLGHDHINCGEMLVFSGMMLWCKERLKKTGTYPNPLPTYVCAIRYHSQPKTGTYPNPLPTYPNLS